MWWKIGLAILVLALFALAFVGRRTLTKADEEEFEEDDPHLQSSYQPAAR